VHDNKAGYAITAVVAAAALQAVKTPATPSSWPLLSKYAEHLREMIIAGIKHPQTPDKPLSGLKIAVDAGNGSGGFFATQVRTSLWFTSGDVLENGQSIAVTLQALGPFGAVVSCSQ
jgi:phosphomannomutase